MPRPTLPNRFRESSANWLLLFPAVALMAIVYFTPLFRVLWISVTEPAFGFGNYDLLFTNAAVRRVLLTTFRVSLTTTVISTLIAYAVAYCLVQASPRHRRTMLMFVLLSFWVSVLIRAFAWVTLFGASGDHQQGSAGARHNRATAAHDVQRVRRRRRHGALHGAHCHSDALCQHVGIRTARWSPRRVGLAPRACKHSSGFSCR